MIFPFFLLLSFLQSLHLLLFCLQLSFSLFLWSRLFPSWFLRSKIGSEGTFFSGFFVLVIFFGLVSFVLLCFSHLVQSCSSRTWLNLFRLLLLTWRFLSHNSLGHPLFRIEFDDLFLRIWSNVNIGSKGALFQFFGFKSTLSFFFPSRLHFRRFTCQSIEDLFHSSLI